MVAVLVGNQQHVERNGVGRADRRRKALEADVFLGVEHVVGEVRINGESAAVVRFDQKTRLPQPEELGAAGLRTALFKAANEIHETKTPFAGIFCPINCKKYLRARRESAIMKY